MKGSVSPFNLWHMCRWPDCKSYDLGVVLLSFVSFLPVRGQSFSCCAGFAHVCTLC